MLKSVKIICKVVNIGALGNLIRGYEILGSKCGDYEVFLPFWRKVMPPFSGSKTRPSSRMLFLLVPCSAYSSVLKM
jgi:hypothetical protein